MHVSPGCIVNDFSVIDSDINFSDHLPLLATITASAIIHCQRLRGLGIRCRQPFLRQSRLL